MFKAKRTGETSLSLSAFQRSQTTHLGYIQNKTGLQQHGGFKNFFFR